MQPEDVELDHKAVREEVRDVVKPPDVTVLDCVEAERDFDNAVEFSFTCMRDFEHARTRCDLALAHGPCDFFDIDEDLKNLHERKQANLHSQEKAALAGAAADAAAALRVCDDSWRVSTSR